MTTFPTPRRWIAFLAATAVVASVAILVRRHLDGGDPAASGGAAVTAPAVPATAPAPPAVHVDPGDEIFAVDLDIVVEVDFEQAGRTVVVRRSQGAAAGGFTISVKTDGTTAPSCRGSAALDDLLARLTSIKVIRVIGGDEAAALEQRFGAAAATLRIRDKTVLDPKEFRVLIPDEPARRALLLDGPALYETSLPRELFDRLSAGCEALGRR